MEIDEVADRERTQARIHQAEGVLSVLLGVSVEQAAVSLDLKAQFGGTSLADAADRVLRDHERDLGATAPPEIGERTLAILRQHLDSAGSPLDQPVR
jgi:hypothetical protein